MRQKNLIANLIVLFASSSLYGQRPSVNPVATNPVATEALSRTSASHASYYIDPLSLHLDLILSPPPARGSATTASELTELHRIEAARTPVQITQAQADDHEEDIFVSRPSLVQVLPLRLCLSRPHFLPMSERMKVRQAVRSRRSITVHAPIRLTARFTQSAHSTRSPLRTPADIRFPAIYLLLLLCN